MLASASMNAHTIDIWNLGTNAISLTIPWEGNRGGENIYYLCYNLADTRLAVGDSNGTISIYDTATGAKVHSLRGHGSPVWCLRMHTEEFDYVLK